VNGLREFGEVAILSFIQEAWRAPVIIITDTTDSNRSHLVWLFAGTSGRGRINMRTDPILMLISYAVPKALRN